MNKFENCIYLGGLCGKGDRCLIEGTMRNQMSDGKSWLDPNSERAKEKIAESLLTARQDNCQNQEALQDLVRKFQTDGPSMI